MDSGLPDLFQVYQENSKTVSSWRGAAYLSLHTIRLYGLAYERCVDFSLERLLLLLLLLLWVPLWSTASEAFVLLLMLLLLIHLLLLLLLLLLLRHLEGVYIGGDWEWMLLLVVTRHGELCAGAVGRCGLPAVTRCWGATLWWGFHLREEHVMLL